MSDQAIGDPVPPWFPLKSRCLLRDDPASVERLAVVLSHLDWPPDVDDIDITARAIVAALRGEA